MAGGASIVGASAGALARSAEVVIVLLAVVGTCGTKDAHGAYNAYVTVTYETVG